MPSHSASNDQQRGKKTKYLMKDRGFDATVFSILLQLIFIIFVCSVTFWKGASCIIP